MRVTKAALARGPTGPFLVESVRIAEPVGDEVLVRGVAVGVCHTDLVGRMASVFGGVLVLRDHPLWRSG